MADIIVAGNTSGAITISAPSAAGSGVLTLPTGTDTLVGKATTDTLTNKSIAATQLTGTIAAAVLPAGSVLQVVNFAYSTITSQSTTTLADTGLTATITPRSASSTILISVCQNGCTNTAASSGMKLVLLRGATIINSPALYAYYQVSVIGSIALTYLDSPATTSATTYKTQYSRSPANTGIINVQDNGVTSTITLMEIQG